MYGLAGAKHTPGMPDMNRQIQRMTGDFTSSPHRKGKAGQLTLGNVDSKQRHKDKKREAEANAEVF